VWAAGHDFPLLPLEGPRWRFLPLALCPQDLLLLSAASMRPVPLRYTARLAANVAPARCCARLVGGQRCPGRFASANSVLLLLLTVSRSPLVPVVLLPQPKKKLKPQAQEKQNSCFPSFPPSCKACFCWTGCCCQPPRQKPLRRCAGGPRNPHHAVAQQSPDSTTDCTALLASPSPRTSAARAHNICLCPFTVPI